MKTSDIRRTILNSLTGLGVQVQGGRVKKTDLMRVFGEDLFEVESAQYTQPEWVHLADLNLGIPAEFLHLLDQSNADKERVVLSQSVKIADFGSFIDPDGQEVWVRGILYQYCYKLNPRSIHCAYKVVANLKVVSENSSLRSTFEAEGMANSGAKEFIFKCQKIG